MEVLAASHDAAVQMIDTSIEHVHQHGAYIAGKKQQDMGRAKVTILDEDTKQKKTYFIVGDASNGRISISSPIVRTTIGKEEGDVVEVTAPGGAWSYEIVKVKY
jgi:transcription elongation GreA/GreB family factor